MDTRKIQEELLVLTAKELAASHGVFFAAALLADFGVPLKTALIELTSAMSGQHPTARLSFALSPWLGAGTLSVTVTEVVAIAYFISNAITYMDYALADQRVGSFPERGDGTVL